MSDTDRLATLLHAEWDWYRACEPSEPGTPCHDCLASAARLIAAGVTLDPRPADALRDAAQAYIDHIDGRHDNKAICLISDHQRAIRTAIRHPEYRAGVTLAPTPPDAPDARGECHKGCDLCRTLNEMDVDDAVPTPPDALTIDQKVEELERIIHPEGRCWCGAGKPYWKHIDPSADGYHPFVPTPPDALDVARIRSIIMDTTDQLLTELDELHFSQKGIIQTRNRILRRLAEELGG